MPTEFCLFVLLILFFSCGGSILSVTVSAFAPREQWGMIVFIQVPTMASVLSLPRRLFQHPAACVTASFRSCGLPSVFSSFLYRFVWVLFHRGRLSLAVCRLLCWFAVSAWRRDLVDLKLGLVLSMWRTRYLIDLWQWEGRNWACCVGWTSGIHLSDIWRFGNKRLRGWERGTGDKSVDQEGYCWSGSCHEWYLNFLYSLVRVDCEWSLTILM